jgi:4-amino-4-deoxy-L-arabinose transferase-like glycosyltransferase
MGGSAELTVNDAEAKSPGSNDAAGDREARWAGWGAGLLALSLYLGSASPFVSSHDTAEFQTLAATGGIAHHGYPTVVLLLQAFAHLPIGTLPFRTALLSCLAGAFAVGLAAWSGARISGRPLAGFFAALALALGFTHWSESSRASVHIFTLAIVAAGFVIAQRLAERPTRGSAFALGLLSGTGLVSHPTALAMVPVVLVAGALALSRRRLRVAHVGLALVGLLVGLSPILYLIDRDRPDQPMNYIHDTLRPDNAEALTGGHVPDSRVGRAIWLLSASQYLKAGTFRPGDQTFWRLKILSLDLFINELPLLGLPLALLGSFVLWRRRNPAALLLSLWLIAVLFLVVWAAHFSMLAMFFLPGLWVLSQLMAVGMARVARTRVALLIVGVLLVAIPFLRLTSRKPPQVLARSSAIANLWVVAPDLWDPFRPDPPWDAYGRGVMRLLPPRAIVLACWEEATTLRYFRYAERLRTDVDILYHCRVPQPAFPAADAAGRPIFCVYPPTLEMTGGRPFVEVGRWARGALWRIDPPRQSPAQSTTVSTSMRSRPGLNSAGGTSRLSTSNASPSESWK